VGEIEEGSLLAQALLPVPAVGDTLHHAQDLGDRSIAAPAEDHLAELERAPAPFWHV
jgi:hypothetical protein